jgi:uncharacterized phage protein gp47/JayE
MSVKIVAAGLNRDEIARLAEASGGTAVVVTEMSDFEAATAIKSGAAEYYIGACTTGAGGALAIATAVLGQEKVVTLSGLTAGVSPEQVERYLDQGRCAFGVATRHIAEIVPTVVRAIAARSA